MTTTWLDLQLEMFRRMVRIRLFEEAAVRLAQRGELPGILHTCVGQEGAVVGACMGVDAQDYMVGTHRSHGHPIGKGASIDRLFAELMGKVTGINRGKGGSMHLSDFTVGSLGETSIVGSGLPVATGAALAAKMQRSGRISLCFFGDGASNQGTFHESLNLASIWDLPVIFFCENNLYGELTPAREVVSVTDIASRAAAYSMPGVVVDGQDVLAVHAAVTEAAERARAGQGPTLVEAKTYRYDNHSFGLSYEAYRTAEEVEQWRARDPIVLLQERLLIQDAVDLRVLDAVRAEEETLLDEAITFARSSAFPEPAEAFEHLYSSPLEVIT
jgi:TPP-dependent pyruvate/acetoin dehydrogenase alpha subunit